MTSTKKNNVFTGLPDERVIDPRTEEEIEAERDAHVGVKIVEAAEKVYGRYSKWFLFLGYVLSGSTANTTLKLSCMTVLDLLRTCTLWIALRRPCTCLSWRPRSRNTV